MLSGYLFPAMQSKHSDKNNLVTQLLLKVLKINTYFLSQKPQTFVNEDNS